MLRSDDLERDRLDALAEHYGIDRADVLRLLVQRDHQQISSGGKRMEFENLQRIRELSRPDVGIITGGLTYEMECLREGYPVSVCLRSESGDRTFANAPGVARWPMEKRHIARGGCVDRFLRAVLTKQFTGREIRAGHDATKEFDRSNLFLLSWLESHRDNFDFKIVRETSEKLCVWSPAMAERTRRNKKKTSKIIWTFVSHLSEGACVCGSGYPTNECPICD